MKKIFFLSLKSLKKRVGTLVIGTDLGIRISTKMSRMPNTELIGLAKVKPFTVLAVWVSLSLCARCWRNDQRVV
jgi:dolichyl-phosphate-mannose--protein O-mannosyl transferase